MGLDNNGTLCMIQCLKTQIFGSVVLLLSSGRGCIDDNPDYRTNMTRGHSFNAYFSTCLLSMFTHTLERKYMFLICNGILAFVAKTLLMNSSDSDFDQLLPSNLSETKTTTVSDMVVAPLMESFASPENILLVVDEQKGQEEYNEEVSEDEDQEQEILCAKTEGRESEGYIREEEITEGESESEVEVAQDDDLAETTSTTNNEELLNTDELNRKFEEFIRKMREEIRIEAQRQLIAV
ncbi:unnamed protein product [Sphenostylis stenocarpa]|uniref:Uncharacterized protein n=1 Tax=Sphenostylis stenocarpa TaxID=92480 RepID=A0AA86T4A5_9FABA|nr:unnamed protein product [Sphenostylis stenocarpa]